MNSKTTITIMVMTVTAFAMIAMPIILENDHALLKIVLSMDTRKLGLLYKKGEHHCHMGTSGCIRTGHSQISNLIFSNVLFIVN